MFSLKKHYDLIPNLVEVVKDYKEYEASVLENVVKARTDAINQSSISGKAQVGNILSESLKSLFAVVENYPQIKASKNFQKFQDQLSVIENDIQSASRYYNAAFREFNNAVQVFSSNIIAKILVLSNVNFLVLKKRKRSSKIIFFNLNCKN